jgi:hypothetical protein
MRKAGNVPRHVRDPRRGGAPGLGSPGYPPLTAAAFASANGHSEAIQQAPELIAQESSAALKTHSNFVRWPLLRTLDSPLEESRRRCPGGMREVDMHRNARAWFDGAAQDTSKTSQPDITQPAFFKSLTVRPVMDLDRNRTVDLIPLLTTAIRGLQNSHPTPRPAIAHAEIMGFIYLEEQYGNRMVLAGFLV